MLDRTLLQSVFSRGLRYDQYLATDPNRAGGWNALADRVSLTALQREEIASFTRDMKVLVVSGIWCGDCVQQGPLLAHIAAANPRIDLRWVDRDVEAEFSEQLKICGGGRVPVVVFAAEARQASFFDLASAGFPLVARWDLSGLGDDCRNVRSVPIDPHRGRLFLRSPFHPRVYGNTPAVRVAIDPDGATLARCTRRSLRPTLPWPRDDGHAVA